MQMSVQAGTSFSVTESQQQLDQRRQRLLVQRDIGAYLMPRFRRTYMFASVCVQTVLSCQHVHMDLEYASCCGSQQEPSSLT